MIAYLFDYDDFSFGFVYQLAGDVAAARMASASPDVVMVRDVFGRVIWERT